MDFYFFCGFKMIPSKYILLLFIGNEDSPPSPFDFKLLIISVSDIVFVVYVINKMKTTQTLQENP